MRAVAGVVAWRSQLESAALEANPAPEQKGVVPLGDAKADDPYAVVAGASAVVGGACASALPGQAV